MFYRREVEFGWCASPTVPVRAESQPKHPAERYSLRNQSETYEEWISLILEAGANARICGSSPRR